MSPPDPNRINDEDLDRAIAAVERSLLELKERYEQVQRDKQRRTELEQARAHLKKESQHDPEIKAQLQQIQQELDTLELNLESRLFNWRSLSQPFWQAVRFGGLGVILGWVLKSWAG
jgi:septal ring factor EnvC (AmiA/AmiB activator)